MKNRRHKTKTGKVHVAVWHQLLRVYDLGCRPLSDLSLILGGVDTNVPDDEEVTCKNCLRKFPGENEKRKVKGRRIKRKIA